MTTITITAAMTTGHRITAADGRPARLAVIDDQGQILAIGDEVAHQVWDTAIKAHENFWKGLGHLQVLADPRPPQELRSAS